MMKTAIDIVLLIIIALCTWDGYKRGVIGSIAAVLGIVISLFLGGLLSETYAGEVIPALRPFVAGYVDAADNRASIVDRLGFAESDRSLGDIISEDPSLRYDYAKECMGLMGFSSERSEELADKAVRLSESEGLGMTDAVVNVLCNTITYVGGLLLGFLMVLIILVTITNISNLSFRLPNMENLDEIGGAVLGFARGGLYCVLLSWLLSFLGLIIGRGTIAGTTLARFFLSLDFITRGLL